MKSYLKTIGIAGICLFLLSPAALAGTKYYVNDTLTITVRTGPALDRKIIALPAVGQEMEVLNTENDWSLVRLPNGKEGWVLSRFITNETLKQDSTQFLELQTKYKKQPQSLLNRPKKPKSMRTS